MVVTREIQLGGLVEAEYDFVKVYIRSAIDDRLGMKEPVLTPRMSVCKFHMSQIRCIGASSCVGWVKRHSEICPPVQKLSFSNDT